MKIRLLMAAACTTAALSSLACGSSSSSPSSSSSSSGACSSIGPAPATPSATPSSAVRTNTITIANCVATPKDIIVTRGTQVTFINNDSQTHEMTANPHPEHTECPEINSAGFLSAGQQRQTSNMVTNRTICGFHDHGLPNVVGLQGSISIQ